MNIEWVRKAARGIVGSNSEAYKYAAEMAEFAATLKSDGLKTWHVLKDFKKPSGNDGRVCSLVLKNLEHPITIRAGTTDAGTVINNVIREEYGNFHLDHEPVWMIDAGAYIGDTTAYFLTRFPGLKVLALEPNPESHEMARINLEPYGNRSVLIQKGLYSTAGIQYFSGDATAAAISSSGEKIDCTTVSELMKEYSIDYLDILKMDIEGAEKAIFTSKPEIWLGRVRMILIECHSSEIEDLVKRSLESNRFGFHKYRSVWYGFNKASRVC